MSAVIETCRTSVGGVQKSSSTHQATESWHPSATAWANSQAGLREQEASTFSGWQGELRGKESQGLLSSFPPSLGLHSSLSGFLKGK